MKTIYISVLLFFALLSPIFSIVKLWGTKRYVTVQVRHEHGAVIIKSKKVRVPYTLEQTSLPVYTHNPVDYFFLKTGSVNFGVALAQLLIGAAVVFICFLGFAHKSEDKYRKWIYTTLLLGVSMFAVSEFMGNSITRIWLQGAQNGIINNPNLFGSNTTFVNRNQGSLVTDQTHDPYQFVMPIVALFLIVLDSQRRSNKALAEYADQTELQ